MNIWKTDSHQETLMTSDAERLQFLNNHSLTHNGTGICKGCRKAVTRSELMGHLGVYCESCFYENVNGAHTK